MGGKVLKTEHIMSIVLLTAYFLITDVSIPAKQHYSAPSRAPLGWTAPASVTGERQADYADEEYDYLDFQGKSRTKTFLSYVSVFK